jgi:hypothetical protein
MKKDLFVTTGLFIILLLLAACSKEKTGGGATTVDCSTVTNKAFTADISPIIQNSCAIATCHASGSSNGPGQLTNYSEIFSARTSIRSAVASGAMPKTGSLSTAQKNSILCWVDSGAPNN